MTGPERVRPDEDWPAMLAMIHRAFAYMDGRIDPPSSLHRLDVEGLRQKAGAEICFIIRRDGAVASCIFCDPRPDCLYVGKLAVDPPRQGQGLGRALMVAAEREARRRTLPALELQTRIELVENHDAFARLGFEKIGETAHEGYDRATSITMRKPL